MEEHTIKPVLDAGFWAAMTIYPQTKNSPARVVDTFERYGLERIMVDASGDWGPSDPGTLHDAIFEMRRRGHQQQALDALFYNNPCRFLGQNQRFKPKPLGTT
jgi:predicted metal-dependent TIM-barrel fold hydrolase